MVKVCLAFGCDQKFTNDNTEVSFYIFPKEKEHQEKWLTALNQKNLEVKPFHVICSKHFKPSDFNIDPCGRLILKPCAVPSIFDKTFNRPKKKVHRKKRKTPLEKRIEPTNKYNFRERKPLELNVPTPVKIIKTNDHTYSSSKPKPQKNDVSTDHRYSASKPGKNITDHTYTRLSAGKEQPSNTVVSSTLRHDEHNYSLNSQKKRAGKSDENEKLLPVLEHHNDHAYLNEKPEDKPLLRENTSLNLRDHTYSKSDKKIKKIDKKSPSPELKIETNIIEKRNSPPPRNFKIATTYDLRLEKRPERPPLIDCVLLSQVGRQKIEVDKFDEIKSNLFILEPIDSDLQNHASINNVPEFNLAPVPFTPTYVLLNSKFLKASKAEHRMEEASLLFEQTFGIKPSEEKITRESFESYENTLCCEGLYPDELLRRCAVRRRFAQPRYVGDYSIADMSCEKNAKRYYELTKTRMDSQRFLIRKLRTQNARLSSRFKKLSQEIVKVKKLITNNNKNSN